MHDTAATRSFAVPPVIVWALIGFGLYLLIGAGSLFLTAVVVDPVMGALGIPAEAGLVGLSVRNALHPVAWGLLVALTSVPIGRRLVREVRFGRASWMVLAVGLGLAAVTWFLIEEFVRARYGYFDAEYVGFSFFAWPALVAIALSGWAALAVRPQRRTPLTAILVLAVVTLAVALLPSVAGAADGIDPGNLPLALLLAVDAVFAVGVVVVVAGGRAENAR